MSKQYIITGQENYRALPSGQFVRKLLIICILLSVLLLFLGARTQAQQKRPGAGLPPVKTGSSAKQQPVKAVLPINTSGGSHPNNTPGTAAGRSTLPMRQSDPPGTQRPRTMPNDVSAQNKPNTLVQGKAGGTVTGNSPGNGAAPPVLPSGKAVTAPNQANTPQPGH